MLGPLLTAVFAAAAAPAIAQVGCAVNPSTYNFEIGGNAAKIIEDSAFILPVAFIFIDDPTVPSRIASDYFLNPEAVSVSVNVLYLELDGEKVIFDTGNGEALGGALIASLQANGINREDITAVFLTHAHGDHVSGLLLADGSLAFPNAVVYVSKTEWEYWRADEVDTLTSQLPADVLAQQVMSAKTVFAAIEENVELFELGDEVMPGITSMSTPWHLPGHSAFKLTFGNDTFIVAGDSLISEVTTEHPWLQIRFDSQPALGPAGRYALLDEIVALGARVYNGHAPFPGLGNVRPVTSAAFRWFREPWTGAPAVVAECPVVGGYGGASGSAGGGYASGGASGGYASE